MGIPSIKNIENRFEKFTDILFLKISSLGSVNNYCKIFGTQRFFIILCIPSTCMLPVKKTRRSLLPEVAGSRILMPSIVAPGCTDRCCRFNKMHCTSPGMMVQESTRPASLIRQQPLPSMVSGRSWQTRTVQRFIQTRILMGPAGSNPFQQKCTGAPASYQTCGRSDLEVERRRCNWYYCGFGSSLNHYL